MKRTTNQYATARYINRLAITLRGEKIEVKTPPHNSIFAIHTKNPPTKPEIPKKLFSNSHKFVF